jgi:hypothetical protein
MITEFNQSPKDYARLRILMEPAQLAYVLTVLPVIESSEGPSRGRQGDSIPGGFRGGGWRGTLRLNASGRVLTALGDAQTVRIAGQLLQ